MTLEIKLKIINSDEGYKVLIILTNFYPLNLFFKRIESHHVCIQSSDYK